MYPGILNISVSISIAHQSIDILKFIFCHFHYMANTRKKLSNGKNQFKPSSPEWTAAVLPVTQKPKTITSSTYVTGH